MLQALAQTQKPETFSGDIPVSVLAGITCRETGLKIAKLYDANPKMTVATVAPIMTGDYSQRPGETGSTYHGFGFTQIDKVSYPDFVRRGDWKDPLKCYKLTIQILQDNFLLLSRNAPNLPQEMIWKYVIASYNAGKGRELSVITKSLDPDTYTFAHNYSSEVLRFVDIYNSFK